MSKVLPKAFSPSTDAFPMAFNATKSKQSNAAPRVRGVILSPQGWQRLQAEKQQVEAVEIWGKHFTQEDLRDRTGLSLNTLYRVLKRELGVDRQSLEYLFRAFGLELTKTDFDPSAMSKEELENQQAAREDWDKAADPSVADSCETTLTPLWQWIISEHCRVVECQAIGGIGKRPIAVKTALQMQAAFETILWRSLAKAPSFAELLSSLLTLLMLPQRNDSIISTTFDAPIDQLLQSLRSRHCLLILDHAETILHKERIGQWRSGYEAYGQLLKIIDEMPHHNCLLLTSRYIPNDVAFMASE